MKPRDIERDLLLRMTGELSADDLKRLEAELAQNAAAGKIEAELESIFSAARSTENGTRISDATMLAIKNQARRELHQKQNAVHENIQQPFLKIWRPAVMYAAVALLLLTLSIPLRQHLLTEKTISGTPQIATLEWDENIDEQLSALDEEITLALLEYSEAADADRGIDALADELLKMEMEI